LACSLWPLSQIYASLVTLRRYFYQWGWLKSRRANAVVVVVGNVLAGGVGKTPTVMAVVEHLLAQKYRPGIISRGYGRTTTACTEVLSNSFSQDVGDEPLLMHQTTGVPVFVARSRHAAAQALLQKHPETDIIVSDDGLQHYGLYRDVEICVFDNRGCGNGWMLPAGPLREAWPRKPIGIAGQRQDRFLVLHTGNVPAFGGYTAQRLLAPFAILHDGGTVSLDSLRIPGEKPLLAVAGIGQPEAFFTMLRALHIPLARTLALPDHYVFDSRSRSIFEGYTIICTQKDAMKLWQIETSAIAIPLEMKLDALLCLELDAHLSQLLPAKLSSRHGHKTT
jgi:tetraacyldisaccharide 4'-kinase